MIDIALGLAVIAAGVALGALKPDLASLDLLRRIWKAAALCMVAAGTSLLLGIVSTGLDHGSEGLKWRSDVEDALAEAREQRQPAVLDTGATWCAACKELEHKTLADPAVVEALRDFVTIRVDMTKFDEAQKRLKKLGVEIRSLPWVGFFMQDGRHNPGVTLTDFEPPDAFLARIELASTFKEASAGPVDAWLGEHGLIVALLLVFLAGIGVSLTPCVYPMIPITIAVVSAGGDSDPEGHVPFSRRAVRSAAFVGGLCVVYACLGVLSASLGKGFGSWLQHPAVSLTMAALFIALAASFIGFYRIDIPAGLKARMGRSRGGVTGAALVGGATGFVAAPCAGPVVVGILAVISNTGDVVLGFTMMMSFSMGMGVLFFGIGLSTALLSRLPRSGTWMERVELVFALAFLVIAVYYGRLAVTSLL